MDRTIPFLRNKVDNTLARGVGIEYVTSFSSLCSTLVLCFTLLGSLSLFFME